MLLQPLIGTWEIDSRCLQGNKPAKKKEKDPKRTKSIDTSFTDISSSKHQ